MGRIDVIKTELTIDELGRGYAGMSDEAAAADGHIVYRTLPIDTLTAAQVYEQIDTGEFDALSVGDQATVDRILGLGGDINLTVTSKARTTLLAVFAGAAGTITRPAIGAAVSRDVDRWTELGVGHVYPGHIQEARL